MEKKYMMLVVIIMFLSVTLGYSLSSLAPTKPLANGSLAHTSIGQDSINQQQFYENDLELGDSTAVFQEYNHSVLAQPTAQGLGNVYQHGALIGRFNWAIVCTSIGLRIIYLW